MDGNVVNQFENTKFKINSVTSGYTATSINNFAGFKQRRRKPNQLSYWQQ